MYSAAMPDELPAIDDDSEDEEESYEDLLQEAVECVCRCAECCRKLLIEVLVEDAEREPRIKERGSPIYTPAELTGTGRKELEGYLLNREDNGYACAFLDQATNLCTIYETRPLACQLFDCAGEGREQLIELGVLRKE
jgi:Fe-S-cluster containining protein